MEKYMSLIFRCWQHINKINHVLYVNTVNSHDILSQYMLGIVIKLPDNSHAGAAGDEAKL